MKINRNNYESFFLDYIEGNLNTVQTRELIIFLEQNPDLANELSEFENVTLVPEIAAFEEKQNIKKTEQITSLINNTNFEQYCIAYWENDLTDAEKKELQSYLELYPDQLTHFNTFSKTYLKPDLRIIYERKSQIKRFSLSKYRKALAYASAAASVAILLSLYIYSGKTEKKSIAQNKITVVDSKKHIETKKQSILKSTNIERPIVSIHTKEISIPTETKNEEQNNLSEESAIEKIAFFEEIKGINSLEQISSLIQKPSIHQTNTDNNKNRMTLIIDKEKTLEIKNQIENIRSKKYTKWDIAENIVDGFNRLTGAHLRIERKVKEDNTIYYAVNSDYFGFEKSTTNR